MAKTFQARLIIFTAVVLGGMSGFATEATARDAVPARVMGNPGSWVTTQDYPVAALRALAQGYVGVALTIDKNGSVSRCEVVQSSGSAPLDTTTCNLMIQRAKFTPARDEKNRKVEGKYRTRVRWVIPAGEPAPDLSKPFS